MFVIFLLVLIYTVNEKLPPLSFAHAIAASKEYLSYFLIPKKTKHITGRPNHNSVPL